MYRVALLAGAALLAISSSAIAQPNTNTNLNGAIAGTNTDVDAFSGSAAVNDGNNQLITFEGAEPTDLSDAIPDVVVPSAIGNGPCSGAGFSAGLGLSGIGLGVGATTIDEDCTIREYVTLLYNMCAAGNAVWCQVADRMLLNEVPMITEAWNDVNAPPDPAVSLIPAPAPAPVAVPAEVVIPVAAPAVNCPATAPRDAGELTELFAAGCRWN